jgi:hypothetical protein
MALALCCFGWKRRRGVHMLLLAGLAVGLSVCTGCGVDSVTSQTKTSIVTLTATDGTLQPSTSFSLTTM